MKISGPGSKLPPEAPGATDESKRSGGSAFAEKVAGQPPADKGASVCVVAYTLIVASQVINPHC